MASASSRCPRLIISMNGLHLGQELCAAGSLGVGVELEQGAQVLQGVLLQGHHCARHLGRPHDCLHFVTVDEAGQVCVGHDVARQLVAALLLALLVYCACTDIPSRSGPCSQMSCHPLPPLGALSRCWRRQNAIDWQLNLRSLPITLLSSVCVSKCIFTPGKHTHSR